MMYKLSIVMPCYNCESTLKEAINSIFTKNLSIPFEIIMVDDGSNDGTKNLILELTKRHKEIIFFFHDENKGGGAARNTGIRNSSGNLILCLDSDDILSVESLERMIIFLHEKKCDGVIFEKNIYFKDKIDNAEYEAVNKINEKSFKISDLFNEEKSFMTLSNFLYTKKAYSAIGGYPEYHSFDTQHFGYAFLGKGFKVFTCPNTYYFQRIRHKKKSYFQRAYEMGDMSMNTYFIYEDIMHLFSNATVKEIFSYDIFGKTKMCVDEIGTCINKLYINNKPFFFRENYENLLIPDGMSVLYKEIKDKKGPEDLFIQAIYLYKKGEYDKSLDNYKKIARTGNDSKIMYFNIIRNFIALSGKYEKRLIEGETKKILQLMAIKKQKIYSLPKIFSIVILNIKRVLNF